MTLYLQLGRLGDVLNILPLCWRDYCETGERPLVMVSEPYASLFDGIGYAECVAVPNKFEDVTGAWPIAEKVAAERGARLVCPQIYGDNLATAETCSSFMRESWAQVPNAPAWGTLPLMFDRRDKAREKVVADLLRRNGRGKPYVVLALDGKSSPFVHSRELRRHLARTIGKDFDVVDISAFVAHRIYDLLALLEGAHCLVSVKMIRSGGNQLFANRCSFEAWAINSKPRCNSASAMWPALSSHSSLSSVENSG